MSLSALAIDPPSVGQLVFLRSRTWLVEDVTPPSVPGESSRVQLACADDDHQGEQLEVLWDFELDRQLLGEADWHDLAGRGFDPPARFAAFYHTLRWNCVTATDPQLFQAPFRAGIRLDAYQMEPLRMALQMPRVNLFIADDTGLGKTIEAGLILRELLLRKKVRSVVVAAPPSVLEQWKAELEDRFGLLFVIVDRAYLTRMRRERGFGVNPWRTHTRFLVSHALLGDTTYADPLREWLGGFQPGSLLVLDEAHHAAPASNGSYGIESKFTRTIRDLAGRFEHRLFLSATPHNGHSNSFSTLLELLDPVRFTRGVKVEPKSLAQVMVRRLKEDIRSRLGGFPKREVLAVTLANLPPDAPELVLSQLLDQYRSLREQRFAEAKKTQQTAAMLLTVGLQQRLLSSFEAFYRSLKVHRRTATAQWDAAHEALDEQAELRAAALPLEFQSAPDADDERSELSDEEQNRAEDAQIAALNAAGESPATLRQRDLIAREQALLAQMEAIAERARLRPDAKLTYLIDWIRSNLCPGLPAFDASAAGPPAQWNNRRVLIFTENREGTKRYLLQMLSRAIATTDQADERIAVIDGLTSSENRQELQRRFNADPATEPLRILLATDAAREGLNFQAHCADLFHYDLPWNPGRIEQRNGRIDRKLQPADTVRCHYFVLPQRVEDRVLQVLVEKTIRITGELGSMSRVLDADIERCMTRQGIRHRDVEQLMNELRSADADQKQRAVGQAELADARSLEIDKQIDLARDLLEKSKRWTQFSAEPFRAALSSALELLGAPALREQHDRAGKPIWRLPELSTYAAKDPTWLATLDTLRAPRRGDQSLSDWRREAPIRPLVFEDSGVLSDATVHLHLDHRVTQRLLGRFRAQGFVENLSRACLVQSSSAQPHVLLIGRLALYGHGAERLHEELVVVSAEWQTPALRQAGRLKLLDGAAADDAQALLDQALQRRQPDQLPQPVQQQLAQSAAADVEQLQRALLKRTERAAREAKKKLQQRGETEATSLEQAIKAQTARISQQLNGQLQLGLSPEEQRQYEADRRAWQQRLKEFDSQRSSEPERIRRFYEVRKEHLTAVGLIYLWPETN
jgi:superfamily II DNA/RNA helicase